MKVNQGLFETFDQPRFNVELAMNDGVGEDQLRIILYDANVCGNLNVVPPPSPTIRFRVWEEKK